MKISEKKLNSLKEKYIKMSVYESRFLEEGNRYIAGVDEAGRGPLAGPVVAAACILNPEDPIYGLDDSKKLSEKKRQELYNKIISKALYYTVEAVDNNIIDDINILNATKIAMTRCIENLSRKPDIVLIDAVKLEDTGTKTLSIVKGDSVSVSIAAASILAKVTRDEIMKKYDNLYPGYLFLKNKGYGTKAHYEGISKNGITSIHRKSFLKNITQNE